MSICIADFLGAPGHKLFKQSQHFSTEPAASPTSEIFCYLRLVQSYYHIEMEGEDDLPARKRRAEANKLRGEEREAARSKCIDACEAGDIDQIRDIIRG